MYLSKLAGAMFCFVLLMVLTPLWGQIGNPVLINTEDDRVYFAGQNGFRQVGETIHLTYKTLDWPYATVIYSRSEYPYQNFSTLEVDTYETILVNPGHPVTGEPVLEVMVDGSVHIFYPCLELIDDEHSAILRRAEISPEGLFVGYETIDTSVYTTAGIVNEQDELHLLYKNGYEHSLVGYSLFYDSYTALDNIPGNVRFFGQDVIYGNVHSNTDIWIRQIGGGNNNGWPTFHGLVTTAGEVRVFGGGHYPVNAVFQGGLIEDYPELEFPTGADQIRMNGIRPFGSTYYDDRIAYVTVNGSSFESWIGHIQTGPVEEFTIYDSYPPYGPVGDSLGVSFIALPDTIWTPGPSVNVQDLSVFVPYELWISGNFSGRQTWGSSHDIYLKGDLIYQNTPVGQPPDGGPDGSYPVNETDMLALVSERSILVQYGYRDPADNLRYKPNTNDIYIYAFLSALGEDDGPNQYGIHNNAGIFSYQYQFPKGSTPSQYWNDEFYTHIDLHRFKYPTSTIEPWPPGLDYPWYNPLWPEPGPVFDHPQIPNPHNAVTLTYLRGNINLFGGFASRMAGYVRRSGNHDYDTGIWDIEEGMFGRHTGTPSGYDKNYHNDSRISYMQPPDIPASQILDGADHFAFHYLRQSAEDDEFTPIMSEMLPDFKVPLHISVHEGRIAILSANKLFLSDEYGSNFQEYQLDTYIDAVDMLFTPHGIYLHDMKRLFLFDIITEELSLIAEMMFITKRQAIAYDSGNLIWAVAPDDETVTFHIYNEEGELTDDVEWVHGISYPVGIDSNLSKLGLQASDTNIYLTIYNTLEDDLERNLYFAAGFLDYTSIETLEIPDIVTVQHYPNPVVRNPDNRNQGININFFLPHDSHVNLAIYNIRGQLIRTLENREFGKGNYTLIWDGRDETGRPVSRGMYFYRLKAGDQQAARKMLILK